MSPSNVSSGFVLVIGLGACAGQGAPALDALPVDVSVSTTTLDFGDVAVHGNSTLTVTLTNRGGTGQIDIASPVGGAAALFMVTPSGVLALASGAQQTLTVTYAPPAASSADDASFAITGSGAPLVISLHGVALQAGLLITPNPINFSFVAWGQTSDTPLHIEALGAPASVVSLTVTESDLDGGPSVFSVPAMTEVIAAGSSTDIPVTFVPDGLSRFEATLTLAISQLGQVSTIDVPMIGFGGGAILTCSPSMLDFGTIATCTPATLPVICTNVGTDVVDAGPAGEPTISVTSSPAGVCTVTEPGDAGWAAGQSVEFDLSCNCQNFDGGTVTLTIQFEEGTHTMSTEVSILGCGSC